MEYKKILNWSGVSEVLTGNPNNIRKNKIPVKHKMALKELEDLFEYWVRRNDVVINSIWKNKLKKK